MPFPPTQAQQSFGTGSVAQRGWQMATAPRAGAMPVAGAAGEGAGVAPTPGVDPAWSRMFGSATPNALLERRAAGEPISPSADPQATAPGGNGGAAGAANAIAPGSAAPGQDPNNGWSNAKEHGGQSNQSEGATAMQAATAPNVPPAIQGPPPGASPEELQAFAEKTKASIQGAPAPVAPPPVPMPQPMVTKPFRPPGQPGQPSPPNALQAATAPPPGAMSPGGNSNFDENTGAYKPGFGPPAGDGGAGEAARLAADQKKAGQAAPAPQTPMQAATAPQAMAAGETQDAGRESAAAAPAGQPKSAAAGEAQGEDNKSTAPLSGDVTGSGDGTLGSGFLLFGLAGSPGTTGHDGPVPSGTSTNTAVNSWTHVPEGNLPFEEGTYNSTGFVHGGKVHPWSTMTWVNPNTGKIRASLDPLAFINSDPSRALTTAHFWDGAMGVDAKNLKNYPTLPDPASNQTPVIFRTTNFSDIAADPKWGTLKPGVQTLVGRVTQLQKDIEALRQNPGTAGSAANIKEIQNKTTSLRVGLAALDKYGVEFSGPAPVTPPAGDGTGNGDGTDDGTTDGGQVGDPPQNTSNTTPGPGGGGSPPDQFKGTNLDTSDIPIKDAGGTYAAYRNNARKIMGPNASDAEVDRATEFLIALKKDQDAENDKQQGLNLIGGASVNAQEDPNRNASQKMMADVLANPDPIDWDTVRNKTVTNSDQQSEQIVKNLSAGAARRGLSTGAVQGYQGRLLGDQANALNSRLGDLDVAKSVAKRQGQLQAMNAENSQYQLFNVGDYNMARDTAGYLANPAQPGQNPAAGFLNAGLGIQAGQTAASAADTAKQNGMIQMAGTAAGLLASIFLTPAAGAAVKVGTDAAVAANTNSGD